MVDSGFEGVEVFEQTFSGLFVPERGWVYFTHAWLPSFSQSAFSAYLF